MQWVFQHLRVVHFCTGTKELGDEDFDIALAMAGKAFDHPIFPALVSFHLYVGTEADRELEQYRLIKDRVECQGVTFFEGELDYDPVEALDMD